MRATRLIPLAIVLVASAPPAGAQRLFRSTEPVEITFTTNLKAIVRERDSTKLNPYGAQMTYKDSTGKDVNVPVILRARGHFRRQARNCQFPPIRWDAKRADVNNTLFQGLTTLKVTTSCRPGQEEYEQYILGEYSVYRLYQLVSPLHFRTRLARITYKDSAKASPDVTTLAFFIEDDKEVARQNKMQIVDTKGALFDDVETTQLMRTSLFEYMVGNTDVSISGLHNIVLLRDSTTLSLNTVAYDFDFTGVVNTRYSSVDPRLRVKRVTERLHRGPCKTAAEWAPIIAHFQAKKGAMDSVLTSITQLAPGRLKSTREFLDGFWKDMANPGMVKRELVEECQKLGM